VVGVIVVEVRGWVLVAGGVVKKVSSVRVDVVVSSMETCVTALWAVPHVKVGCVAEGM
jgi:hypothetical protein